IQPRRSELHYKITAPVPGGFRLFSIRTSTCTWTTARIVGEGSRTQPSRAARYVRPAGTNLERPPQGRPTNRSSLPRNSVFQRARLAQRAGARAPVGDD